MAGADAATGGAVDERAEGSGLMPNDSRKFRDPTPVIPGRPFDWIMNQQPKDKRSYQAIRELENVKTELQGATDLSAATANDLLVFDGVSWTPIDKTALLSLNDLTDAAVGSPSTNQALLYNGSAWVNSSLSGVLALNDLSDVTVAAATSGQILAYETGQWRNQNYTRGKLGIGTTLDPTHLLEMESGNFTGWFTSSSTLGSSAAGHRVSKVKTDSTHRHGYSLHSDGASCWELLMDSDTNNALRSGFGNADVGLWDYSAGAGGGFALRVSPEEAASSGTGTKFYFGRGAATPRAFTGYVTIQSPAATLRSLVLMGHASQSVPIQEGRTSGGTVLWQWSETGKLGIGVTPTAFLHLPAGTATANTAPLKFTSGTNLTTAEAGAFEYDGTNLYYTPSGTTRRTVDYLPTAPPTYTVTNGVTDRSFDASATTLGELANVVYTIIADMQAQGRFV